MSQGRVALYVIMGGGFRENFPQCFFQYFSIFALVYEHRELEYVTKATCDPAHL